MVMEFYNNSTDDKYKNLAKTRSIESFKMCFNTEYFKQN